jgi:hypothetical protein
LALLIKLAARVFSTEFVNFFNPPDSPDLSPIENVWKYLSQKLQAQSTLPMTKKELMERVTKLWNEIPQEWIDLRIIGGRDYQGVYIPGMKERWEDVYDAKESLQASKCRYESF